MPAEIRSLLNGPAGPHPPPPPQPPAIDKSSLRRLSETISGLDEARLNALIELLVAAPASGISERDATLNLDLEALPIRVFRKVWHFVYDPASIPRPAPDPVESSQESKRNVIVADVIDGPDSPFELPVYRSPSIASVKPTLPPHSYEPSPYPRRRSTYIPVDGEDDELKDDPDASSNDLPPIASGSTPYVPTKRKASSSRAGKQKRRASSPSSRSDASGNSQREYQFVPPAPHAGPEAGSGSESVSTLAPGAAPAKVQWAGHRAGIPCSYVSPIPDTPACTRTFSRVADMRRHIDHQHCEEEAQAVIDGRLTRSQATLLGEDWKGKISKPTCEGCGQTFSRKDAVKRHQAETGAKFVDGVCTSCPGSGNGSGTGKKRARRK